MVGSMDSITVYTLDRIHESENSQGRWKCSFSLHDFRLRGARGLVSATRIRLECNLGFSFVLYLL